MKRRSRIYPIVCLWACTLAGRSIMAAPQPVQSAQKDASGVTLKLQTGLLRLQVFSDRTIHVTCSATDKLPEKKEVVVLNIRRESVAFDWREEPGQFVLHTSRVSVNVDRATGALTFVDAAGKTLLEEPADGARTLSDPKPAAGDQPALYRVQQTFKCPEDERLYGMAECQDGIWNWRGMPIELRQMNTQAALPVLVSSRGYGLFWDNASMTDFNPVDQEIPLSANASTAPATGPRATEELPGAVGGGAGTRAGGGAGAGGGGGGGGRGAGRGAASPRNGTFTTGEAGEYVFFVKGGNRSGEIGIMVNGETISDLRNQWVPYTTAAKMKLSANTSVPVRVLGGGNGTRLYARPLGNTTTFRSSVGESIDYYFFAGPELDDVVAGYRNATGDAPMWPKWAYGFWQCRERYDSSKQLIDTATEFRRRQIPVDLIVQDWQYWGNLGWGAYEMDKAKYPDTEKLTQSLHEQNVKFMISVWSNPGGSTKAGADLKAKKYTIPGTDYVDQTNPAARELRWKYINEAFFKPGTDAWWQDATEPADDGNPMAGKQIFLGSGDLYRNSYPLFANQTVYDGQRATNPEKRVVTLSRSAFPGQQRYATVLWSGDINGTWDAYRRQIPAGLNVCLTGLPYWTTDCGGFFRPGGQFQSDDFADLLTRWFQYSTFCPVQRIHGYQTETEMWKYPKAQDNLIAYDKLRYRMLPYNYSVAWKVTHDAYTIMRALPMDFRSDPATFDISDQYMFGPAFLVSPVMQPKATTRSVYLPAATTWINFWTGESTAGGKRVDAAAPEEVIPLFVRAGSIVPLGPDLQYATEKPADPLELRVYRGADGTFTLYEDEGDSYRYEKGTFATIPLSYKESTKTLTIGDRAGEFPGMLQQRTFRVVWVRPGKGVGPLLEKTADAEVRYTGKAIEVKAP